MADQRMTDDELSEIEECIDDACQASPVPVTCSSREGCCPLAALTGDYYASVGGDLCNPDPKSVAVATGLPEDLCIGFTEAFDGFELGSYWRPEDAEAATNGYAMGLRFRERYP